MTQFVAVIIAVIADKFSNYIENNMHDPIEQSKVCHQSDQAVITESCVKLPECTKYQIS